jgi:hypothetical protein
MPIEKRVVKVGGEVHFKTPQNFLENSKKTFQNFGTLEKF